jgi:hypothetical protein
MQARIGPRGGVRVGERQSLEPPLGNIAHVPPRAYGARALGGFRPYRPVFGAVPLRRLEHPYLTQCVFLRGDVLWTAPCHENIVTTKSSPMLLSLRMAIAALGEAPCRWTRLAPDRPSHRCPPPDTSAPLPDGSAETPPSILSSRSASECSSMSPFASAARHHCRRK